MKSQEIDKVLNEIAQLSLSRLDGGALRPLPGQL
jgi:hypothetical protein